MKFPVYCLWLLCLFGPLVELRDMDLMCDGGI